jgi:hypothetical protein
MATLACKYKWNSTVVKFSDPLQYIKLAKILKLKAGQYLLEGNISVKVSFSHLLNNCNSDIWWLICAFAPRPRQAKSRKLTS